MYAIHSESLTRVRRVDLSNALLVPGEADVAAWHETLE